MIEKALKLSEILWFQKCDRPTDRHTTTLGPTDRRTQHKSYVIGGQILIKIPYKTMHDNLKYDKRQTWNWIESQMLNQLNTAEWNHNYFGKDLILHWDNCHFMVFWVSPGYSHVWHHSVLLVTSCRAIPWNVVASKASPYQFVFTEISVYGHVRWPISTIKSVRYVYSMFWYFIVHSLVCIWLNTAE